MNFQELQSVETAQWYIDTAFKAGNKLANNLFETAKRRTPKLMNSFESDRVLAMAENLKTHFIKITSSFPSFDNMPEFYQQLTKVYFSPVDVKKHLAALDWCMKQATKLARAQAANIRKAHTEEHVKRAKNAFFGRFSSLVKQVKPDLEALEKIRRTMKQFPHIKTDCATICIVGFPSVGKSTLLSKLTTAKPKIAAYDFTTTQLNTGYATFRQKLVQFIDAPGTLHREKMNDVERQAHLAMKYLAELIIFVYDPTRYEDETQRKLLKDVKEYDKDFIMFISKTDLIDDARKEELRKQFPDALFSIDNLKKRLILELKNI